MNPRSLRPPKPEQYVRNRNPRLRKLAQISTIIALFLSQIQYSRERIHVWMVIREISPQISEDVARTDGDEVHLLALYGAVDLCKSGKSPLLSKTWRRKWRRGLYFMESRGIWRLGLGNRRIYTPLCIMRTLGAVERLRLEHNFWERNQVGVLRGDSCVLIWTGYEGQWESRIIRSSLSFLICAKSDLSLLIYELDSVVYKLTCSCLSWRIQLLVILVKKKTNKGSFEKTLVSDPNFSKENDEGEVSHSRTNSMPTMVQETFKGGKKNQPFEAGFSGSMKEKAKRRSGLSAFLSQLVGVKENILQLKENLLFAYVLGDYLEVSRLRQKLRTDWKLRGDFLGHIKTHGRFEIKKILVLVLKIKHIGGSIMIPCNDYEIAMYSMMFYDIRMGREVFYECNLIPMTYLMPLISKYVSMFYGMCWDGKINSRYDYLSCHWVINLRKLKDKIRLDYNDTRRRILDKMASCSDNLYNYSNENNCCVQNLSKQFENSTCPITCVGSSMFFNNAKMCRIVRIMNVDDQIRSNLRYVLEIRHDDACLMKILTMWCDYRHMDFNWFNLPNVAFLNVLLIYFIRLDAHVAVESDKCRKMNIDYKERIILSERVDCSDNVVLDLIKAKIKIRLQFSYERKGAVHNLSKSHMKNMNCCSYLEYGGFNPVLLFVLFCLLKINKCCVWWCQLSKEQEEYEPSHTQPRTNTTMVDKTLKDSHEIKPNEAGLLRTKKEKSKSRGKLVMMELLDQLSGYDLMNKECFDLAYVMNLCSCLPCMNAMICLNPVNKKSADLKLDIYDWISLNRTPIKYPNFWWLSQLIFMAWFCQMQFVEGFPWWCADLYRCFLRICRKHDQEENKIEMQRRRFMKIMLISDKNTRKSEHSREQWEGAKEKGLQEM